MNTEAIKPFCQELNSYLKSSYQYKTDPAYTDFFLDTINTKPRVKFELYLRWQPSSIMWKDDTLVIARIGFRQQRKGHGTRFLQFISDRAKKYGYKKIVIEMAHTDAIKNFVSQLGFKNNDCGYRKCWGISTDLLAQKLAG